MYDDLRKAGFDDTQIERYKRCIFTEEKLHYLRKIKEHCASIDFIDFLCYETMSVNQLKETLKLMQDYAHGWISKEDIEKKIEEFIEIQLSNRPEKANIGYFIKDYLTPEVFQFVEFMYLSFNDELNDNEIIVHRVKTLSIEGIEKEIQTIANDMDPLFYSDKGSMSFVIHFYNEEYCTLHFNTRTLEIKTRYTPDEIKEKAIKEQQKEIRTLYERYEKIKCSAVPRNDRIAELKDILCSLKDLDTLNIHDPIIDSNQLNEIFLKEVNKGPSAVKVFLADYDAASLDDYYFLNAEGNIEMLNDEKVELLFSEIDELTIFKDIRSIKHSWHYISRLSEDDQLLLIQECNKNLWLSDNEYNLNDYPFNFIRCHRKLDLLNYMERGNWAIRDGFVYDNLAFVQQINGGDEYLTLIKHGNSWIPFESISVQSSIREGKFYKFIDDLYLDGETLSRDFKKKSRLKRDELHEL